MGTSDPTGHYLAEIDPEISRRLFGAFRFNLHPLGTRVCPVCEEIYPESFECCPGLIDLAFAARFNPTDDWSPDTGTRIDELLTANVIAAKNVAQLRLLQVEYRDVDSAIGENIRRCLAAINREAWIDEIADELS